MVVVAELGGTITVVALCDGGGLLAQPQSIAPRINKLDTAFIFISSFNRQTFPGADCRPQVGQPDMGLPGK
jgi:hypothetical protein